jgi:nucleoside-diphosphate-sugar epimerase
VRDLSDAHIKALTTPAAGNKRFLIGGAQRFTHTMAVHLAAQIPEIADRVPKDSGEDPLVFQADTAETDKILEMKYRSKEETFLDMAKKILELEKQ